MTRLASILGGLGVKPQEVVHRSLVWEADGYSAVATNLALGPAAL
jgi:hypothetical protein